MATKVNLTIDAGATFSSMVDYVDESNVALDFTGYTGAAQMRKHFTSNTAYNFSVSLSNTGVVTLYMPATTTANLVAGRYVYDVEVTDGASVVSRIVEGIVTVTPNVTRT